jgi:Uma2 family endonuclease
MTKNPPHSLATQVIRDTLAQMILGDYFVSDQEPITTEDSEPEPDVMIVQGKRRDYADRHPSPKEVLLVVEVADTTLQRDKTVKLRVYAQAGIPNYWLLNLPERQLEVYHQASETSYKDVQIYKENDHFEFWLAGQKLGTISVAAILP